MDSLEELEKQLEKLEHDEFMLKMADHWDNSDYKYSWELHTQIKEIKQKIKELKEGNLG